MIDTIRMPMDPGGWVENSWRWHFEVESLLKGCYRPKQEPSLALFISTRYHFIPSTWAYRISRKVVNGKKYRWMRLSTTTWCTRKIPLQWFHCHVYLKSIFINVYIFSSLSEIKQTAISKKYTLPHLAAKKALVLQHGGDTSHALLCPIYTAAGRRAKISNLIVVNSNSPILHNIF